MIRSLTVAAAVAVVALSVGITTARAATPVGRVKSGIDQATLNTPKCQALGGTCGAATACQTPNLTVQKLCDPLGAGRVCCAKRALPPP